MSLSDVNGDTSDASAITPAAAIAGGEAEIVVESQLDWLIEIVEHLGIQPGVQRLHRRSNRASALLERDSIARAQGGFGEPAHRGVHFTVEHWVLGVLGTADEHVAVVVKGVEVGDGRGGAAGNETTGSSARRAPADGRPV